MAASFKDMLWKSMKDKGWNYEDLAQQVGVTGVYVSKIVQGKVVPSDEVIYRLSQALELELERLILAAHLEKAPEPVKPIFARLSLHSASEHLGEAAGFDNVEVSALGPARAVPVVGLVAAGAFMASEDGDYPPGVADAYVYTDHKGRNLFAVKVVNDSMAPEFREGDVLVVNPNLAAKSGDYVIARLVDDNEATFKKLVVHDRLMILRPLNPRYHDLVITDPAKVEIVGKVVERKTLF